jgi:LPXTG-motif cell wall-anchored protein
MQQAVLYVIIGVVLLAVLIIGLTRKRKTED